jgi:raffinose/stachyose/melibiose transport system permease protein
MDTTEADRASVVPRLMPAAGVLEPRQPGRSGKFSTLSGRHQFFLLLVPLVVFATFFILPNLLNFAFSLTNWNSYTDVVKFIGLQNFQVLASNGTLWGDLRTTLIFALLVAIFQNTFGLILALGLEKTTRANGVLRGIFFVPVLLSPLAVGYLFRGLLAYDGPVNTILSVVTGHAVHLPFLSSNTWTLVVVAGVQAWKFFGLTMLIYISGLAAIPEELGEAATLDGAGRWQTFWRIKWRLLAPALTVNITLTLIGSLNAFDVLIATTGGGPGRATEVFNIFVFQQFGNGAFGQSTAMALVLFLTVVVIALPLVSFLRKRELEA